MIRYEDVAARSGDEPDVLRNLNFNLDPGAFYFPTGPSGSGKTMLIVFCICPCDHRRARFPCSARRSGTWRPDVEELLDWVGLGEHLLTTPDRISGGEQQRLAIARAVVAKPDLILADEPSGNIDPEMGPRLMRLFHELNRPGTTVVVATRDRG